jgi:hypothetical protein
VDENKQTRTSSWEPNRGPLWAKQTKTHFELGTELRPIAGENKQKRTSSWEPNRGPLWAKTNKNALRAGNRTAAHCGRKQTKTHFELGTEPRPIVDENKQKRTSSWE